MVPFEEEYLSKIRKVLDFAVNNPYSDFYKNKYKNLDFDVTKINSIEDFQKIPPLTKEEILSVPLEERTLVSQKKVDHYTKSSGTTNSKNILVLPHVYFKQENIPFYKNFNEDILEEIGVKNFLVLRPSDSPIYTLLMAEKKTKTKSIGGDVNNIPETAKLSKKEGITGIVTTPTLLYFLEKELEKIDFDKNIIKWIWLAGELLTQEKFNFFKKKFPNAWIEVKYGATENLSGLTPRGYQCREREFSPKLYHIYPGFYLETLNDEILQTDLFDKAFPLIRYRSGDYGKVFKDNCKCGNENFLELGGRDSFDVLRAEGLIIYAEVIERAIFMADDYLLPEWQLHVYEKKDGEIFKPEFILDLILRKNIKNSSQITEKIINILSENIYLSKGKNLKWFVENNKILPLKINFNKNIQRPEKKSKNIISHLN